VAAMIGVEKFLRIDLDATQGPVGFVRQVLDRLPEEGASVTVICTGLAGGRPLVRQRRGQRGGRAYSHSIDR
jgi:hypothetical protein